MILPTTLYHLDEIFYIENSVFKKPWTRNQIKNDIQFVTNSENWVYIMNDIVIGYIFGWIIQDEFHLNNIAVHPEYVRKNIGTTLIQHIIVRMKN